MTRQEAQAREVLDQLNDLLIAGDGDCADCDYTLDMDAAIPVLLAYASSAQPAWRSIDTAPKDGTMVLLFPSRSWTEDEDRGEVAYWDNDFLDWMSLGPQAEDYFGPTHWMPLPLPPEESTQ